MFFVVKVVFSVVNQGKNWTEDHVKSEKRGGKKNEVFTGNWVLKNYTKEPWNYCVYSNKFGYEIYLIKVKYAILFIIIKIIFLTKVI